MDALSLIGKVLFGRWKLDELLEAGPRGARYRALEKTGPVVDLWVRFPVSREIDPLGVTRARETWSALVELRKDGLPIPDPIDLEVHPDSGMAAAAFEWYDDPTLIDHLRSVPSVPAAAVRDLLVALAEVLDRAHRAGVSHGDLHASDVTLLRGWNHDAGAVALLRLGLEAFIGDREVLPAGSLQRRSSRRGQRADRGRVLRDIHDLARLGCAAMVGDADLDTAVLRAERSAFGGAKIEVIRGGRRTPLTDRGEKMPEDLANALTDGLTRSDSPPFTAMADFGEALRGATAPSKGGRGNRTLLFGGVGAVAVIAVVGTGLALTLGGDDAPAPEPEVEEGSLEAALAQADQAWFEDDWGEAAEALQDALQADENSREALDRLDRIAANCEAKGGECDDLLALRRRYR